MENHTLQKIFFFDMPLSDVYGVGCAALRLIYHGCEEGAFSRSNKKVIDLDHVTAFQLVLKHRTVTPLSDKYDYNLVYYRKDFAANLWSGVFRRGCPTLRKITRRVKLGSKQDLKPNRLRSLYIKSNRPVHVARYESGVPIDHYVPLEYVEEFDQRFDGFLMRSKKGFPLVTSLFNAQGLALSARRDMTQSSKESPHVLMYSECEKQRVTI